MTIVSTGRASGLSTVNLDTGETTIATFMSGIVAGPRLTPDQAKRAYEWASGSGPLIQVALYDIPDDMRELFITGMSNDEWDAMWKDDQDEAQGAT